MKYDTFAAANSSKGFFSFFDELVGNLSLNHVYLIKGGPGCGKSTFMKRIAESLHSQGLTVEQIYCSSDPESLDGIYITEKNIVIIDATPPHSYDMRFPGAFDSIIDLSQFWNCESLKENRTEIERITKHISQSYKKTYSILKSAGLLYNHIMDISSDLADYEKIVALVKKIIKQNAFTPINRIGKTDKRFLTAISCNGIINRYTAEQQLCTNKIILKDDALLSGKIISKFMSYFTKSGYDVIAFYNPLCPDTKIDHIIVPKLKFGIFSSNQIFTYNYEDNTEDAKIINTRNYLDKEKFNQSKNKISFIKKLVEALLNDVIKDLKSTKELHDSLERFYMNAVDYTALNKFTKTFISNI